MSEIENITDSGRRRRWSAVEKLWIVEETLYDGESISVVARRNGAAPSLLYGYRRITAVLNRELRTAGHPRL